VSILFHGASPPNQRTRLGCGALALAIAAVTFGSFAPALWSEFVEWDDDYNFLSNPHYRGLGWRQLVWMVTTAWSGHWAPVTWLTLSLDWTVWGIKPFGYHLTSLLFHAANAAVFFLVASRLLGRALPGLTTNGTRAGAAVAALAFALHPLRAESVAWVSERRDVVSGLFYLLTVLTYLRAAETEAGRRRRWLALSVTAFALAMMSKAIVMSLPLVLLVLDVYPLRRLPSRWADATAARIRPILLEKVPYVVMALAGASAAASMATEFTGVADYPLWARPAVFSYDLAFYLWKTLVPYGLSPLYELPGRWDPRDPRLMLGLLLSASVTIALLVWRRRWPAGLAAWIAYVVTLAPVSGLVVHTGPQIAADRYTYLACLGFALLAGGGIGLLGRADWLAPGVRRFVTVAATVMLAGLAGLAWQQTEIWHDSVTLWEHAVAVDPQCARCQRGLGTSRHTAGASAGAIEPLRHAIALRPEIPEFHADLGLILLWLNRAGEAVPHLERATAAFPANSQLQTRFGAALIQTGRVDDGRRQLEAVLGRRPDHVEALTTMGFALTQSGRPTDAVSFFERAVARAPAAPGAHYGLARVYLALGDRRGAERELVWLRAFDPALAERARLR
jgi:protein O-mannosyl-transferase